MGAIRTNTHRYDEIRPHWEGSILAPKSVACIANLEKAKVKELAIKVGYMYTAKFSVHKYNLKLPFKNIKYND